MSLVQMELGEQGSDWPRSNDWGNGEKYVPRQEITEVWNPTEAERVLTERLWWLSWSLCVGGCAGADSRRETRKRGQNTNT